MTRVRRTPGPRSIGFQANKGKIGEVRGGGTLGGGDSTFHQLFGHKMLVYQVLRGTPSAVCQRLIYGQLLIGTVTLLHHHTIPPLRQRRAG